MFSTMEILNLSSAPVCEDCAQVGSENYSARAKKECRVYREQLIRTFGEPPAGCSLVIKSFPHDFGSYYEVCAKFDPDDEVAADYAYNIENNMPETLTLSQNYPNPFNPTTSIEFSVPERDHVQLTVYNLQGQVIEVLVDEVREPGYYTAEWDASSLGSGTYLYEVKAGDLKQIKKMNLIR